jgi:hypothetical protein
MTWRILEWAWNEGPWMVYIIVVGPIAVAGILWNLWLDRHLETDRSKSGTLSLLNVEATDAN